jgi:flagellar biosynthesis/type III secretory pathway chaperone
MNDCRDVLSRLLDEESTTLRDLVALLEREHELLVANRSAEALEDACEARQICMGTLLRVQDERRGLLRLLGQSDSSAALDELLTRCDPGGDLKTRWAATLADARRCRDLNDRNGALVNARMRRVEGLLNVLTGERATPNLYGPQGQVSASRSQSVVSAQA